MNRSSLMRLAVTFLTAQPVMGFACAGASLSGKPVHFGDQVNIIIWDAATKTEHFVRQAFFQPKAKQFGFIAPTPTKPALSEADDAAFKTLTALNPSKSNYAAPISARAFGGELQIVQEQDVGVYHAATLLATSASALSDWMKANGYVTTPAIEE